MNDNITVGDVTDFESNCAACGVNERVEDSRYCAGCHEALVEQ